MTLTLASLESSAAICIQLIPMSSSCREFPFMKPPVGCLRWRAPIIERDLAGYPNSRKINGRIVYYATDVSPECPGAFEAESITEDCTYLDIFVPKQAIKNSEVLKIFLYFHGGAFMGGSNQDVNANEGAIIASEQNLVVITSNYRLGVFGFLFSEHLDDRIADEHGLEYYEDKITSGNQGLMDQQMAMIWTAENAKYFAGNAERITIGGMSAGGQSMHAHLVMPSSRDLFHKAIAFSGPNGIPYYNNSEGEQILQGIANLVDCCEAPAGVDPICVGPTTSEIISCMTGKSSQEINSAAWELRQILPFGNFARLSMIAEPYAPIINTGMLEEMPYYHFKKGEMHDKPTIVDVTDNEGYMFVKPAFSGNKCPNDTYPDSQHACQENMDLFFEKILSEEDFQALKEFGFYECPEDGSECLHKADEFLTDFTWYCNLRRCLEDGYPQSDIFRSHRNTPLYLARVSQRLPWQPVEDGVMHGASEHWFFNDTFRSDSKYEDDMKFQYSYVQYISNFIRTGDPNSIQEAPEICSLF
ncbi:unnamed protein product [Oikopleura dioica]|uniref:Carboxylesterase type B domain-containing protein n=1 Tax=Oikopleura dioica TaxID=34765 RepID=E4XXH8_OIKDI|nr:unnamed protein product [Oikopleura dioica]